MFGGRLNLSYAKPSVSFFVGNLSFNCTMEGNDQTPVSSWVLIQTSTVPPNPWLSSWRSLSGCWRNERLQSRDFWLVCIWIIFFLFHSANDGPRLHLWLRRATLGSRLNHLNSERRGVLPATMQSWMQTALVQWSFCLSGFGSDAMALGFLLKQKRSSIWNLWVAKRSRIWEMRRSRFRKNNFRRVSKCTWRA